jgi:hypothetical protein
MTRRPAGGHEHRQRGLLALDKGNCGGPEEMHLQAGLGIASMHIHGENETARAALDPQGDGSGNGVCDSVQLILPRLMQISGCHHNAAWPSWVARESAGASARSVMP